MDRVCVYNGTADGVDSWPARDTSVFYEATLDVGIASGKAPPEFASAALMIVRELQEGNMLDKLDPNIVDLILKDHVLPPLTSTDELLADAGVRG